MLQQHPDQFSGPISEGRIPVIKRNLYTGLKVLAILLLLTGIFFLAMMQWRSDAIISKAVSLIQSKMEDSIAYDRISLEWIRYFPNAAIRLEGLQVGKEAGLVKDGHMDIVLRLLPLINEKVIINELRIRDSYINITLHKGKWTYDLFKKTMPAAHTASVENKAEQRNWEALIRQISLENTIISYDDTKGMQLKLNVSEGSLKGNLASNLVDTDIELNATLHDFKSGKFVQNQPFPFEMKGSYKYLDSTGYQELKNWKIDHDQIEMEINGHMRKVNNSPWMDMELKWTNGDPQFIKSILPSQSIRNWDDYEFAGRTSGHMQVKGNASANESPHIVMGAELKSGSVRLPGDAGQMKHMVLNVHYNSGEAKERKDAYFSADLHNASYQGNNLKGELRLDNLSKPVAHVSVKGALPAGLLNLFMDSSVWNFQKGVFDTDQFEVKNLSLHTISTKTLIRASEGEFNADGVFFIYNGDKIEIHDADLKLTDQGAMSINAESFSWNLAKGENIKGDLLFAADKVAFELVGSHSSGDVKAKGNLSGLGTKPVIEADWIIKGIEMQELLASFENFDQTFITSENLKGQADIWAHTIIPYDPSGNVVPKSVKVLAAIDIEDGELKGMKTLEDFGKYVHIDDLRHIKFNAFRNYMKIEQGKVFLPVMFLQSSAINMSINGEHTFDQDINYNLKINAGQAAASKLRKKDPLKRFKQARKSGWINLYFVLSGNVNAVQYDQDQQRVISSFEASTQVKESLRKYLVDRFGHDVYWLEPNEWEEIPEYK